VLKVRVQTAPENGAADEGLSRPFARALGRPAPAVSPKTFLIAGEGAALAKDIAALTGH